MPAKLTRKIIKEKKMKLNIYEKKKIVKTYTAETYDLMWGVIEDVADAVKIDNLTTGSDVEIIKLVGAFVASNIGTVKELIKDVFEGITDEELRNTKVSEIVGVMIDIVRFTIAQLMIGAKELKN